MRSCITSFATKLSIPGECVFLLALVCAGLHRVHPFCGNPHPPFQPCTHNMGFSARFPAKKGPGNLTPKTNAVKLTVWASDILFPYRSPSHQPHPDPTQHLRNGPETDPKQTRNGAKRSQTDPTGAKRRSSPLEWDCREGCRGGGGGWGL